MHQLRRKLKVKSPQKRFVASAAIGDLNAMRAMVAKGFDVNVTNKSGESVFAEVMYSLLQEQDCYGSNSTAYRYEVVRHLLLWGASPNGHEVLAAGPLVFAAMHMDSEMIEILIDAGAEVNAARVFGGVPETVYDSAEFEYRYAVWYDCMEEADNAYRGDEDEWLAGLDRAARRLDRCRPQHLRLLRDRGALSFREMF